MTGIPHQRTQKDGAQDEYSFASSLDTGDEKHTRQEFKDEADLNILLARFGVSTPIRTDLQYGQEVDYNLDLQQAFAAIESARRANLATPAELRDKYPSWREVLNGAESGEYQRDLQALADKQTIEKQEQQRTLEYEAEMLAAKRREKVARDLKREREELYPLPEATPKP